MKRHPETHDSLWILVASPLVWAGHFMASYLTAAIWCAKFSTGDGSLGPVRWAIAIYSVVALAIIGMNFFAALRRQRSVPASTPNDDDTPQSRHRFLGFSAALLSGLSGIAVVFAALVIVFIQDCR